MPKRIECPVEKYTGYVILHDPLTFPQVIAFQDAINNVRSEEGITWTRLRYELLQGILPCVKEWHLENFPDEPTIDTFPATPLIQAGKVVDWLQREITELLSEAENIPNG